MNKVLVLFLVATVFFACEKKKEFQKFQDPYLDAVRNKGVRLMISLNPRDSSTLDTTWFDKAGNISRIKGYGINEKREYDSLNFIIRSLVISDIYDNIIFNYRLDKENRTLFQEWIRFNHQSWDITDFSKGKLFTVVKFQLDESGRVVNETDTLSKQYFTYKYGSNDRLLSKESFSIDDQRPLTKWTYEYEGPKNSTIKKITCWAGDQEFAVYYYNNGVLDSSIEDRVKTKYKFIYH